MTDPASTARQAARLVALTTHRWASTLLDRFGRTPLEPVVYRAWLAAGDFVWWSFNDTRRTSTEPDLPDRTRR